MSDEEPVPGATRDALLAGEVVLWQPPRGQGYRFNLDPVLLAGFVTPTQHAVDLGAGCGVIGLLLLAMQKAEQVTLVERQADLAACARRNVEANAADARATVFEADLRQATLPNADAVLFNPPYFAEGSGRRPPDPGRGAGRHETHGTLADFVRVAVSIVRPGGRLAAIVRAERGDELQSLVRDHGAAPTRRRVVVPRRGEPPRHLLLEAERGATSPEVSDEPALIVHAGAERTYSDEVRALLRE